ncbi:hypothetical protein SAMN02745121_05859 [Nannocystis exedens]|uniref:Uncharacterized protein n=1 Tax=Nannocystis exedens TaxID=54 RepID=A0A1I2E1S1_9BACT|nr:hypothetical protein [Nannocystis exedens]PCC69214.1 hypothetical protein NAEX_02236 [Nannocystis exedens]SFE86563.1 hypothetical protein SAMN02745121_05859 [Nannocystis exedens]
MTNAPRAGAARAITGALGLVLAGSAREAAADGVPYDAEKYGEAKTSIEVHGVAALGDVVLVVYPYPCEVSGAFERFEEALKERPDARLAVALDDTVETRGYLVVGEGERFESTTNHEGPYAICYFFGLPRAAFPAEGGAIARLDAMTHEERWRLFSRDPSVVRTGVALAMDGVVKLNTERSRVVTYEARRDGAGLAIEEVRWTWGSGRVQDPRRPSRRDVKVIDPYEDDGRVEEQEAKYFAGSLIGAPWGAEAPAKAGAVVVEGKAAGEGKASEGKASEGKGVEVASAGPAVRSEAGESAIDFRLIYGGACLFVAAGAGMMLRRRR